MRYEARVTAWIDRLNEAVNEQCSCGGAGPGEGCVACEIWHRSGAFHAREVAAQQEARWQVLREWLEGEQADADAECDRPARAYAAALRAVAGKMTELEQGDGE